MPRRRVVDPVLPGRYVGALDLRQEVPTPAGTTTLEQLSRGDTVFGSTGTPAVVAEISEPLTGLPCFEVEFSTGDTIVADDEQRWLTERRDVPRTAASPWRRATPVVADSVAERGPAALGVRVAPAIQLPAKRLPVDPYLLGAWLGRGIDNSAALIGASDELIRRLHEEGVRVFSSGLPAQVWIAVPDGARQGEDLASELKKLRVLGDKHVPTAYLRGSEAQRRTLLAALLDGGGRVSDGGEVLFRAATHDLAVGVHELIASLGYRPWLRPYPAGHTDVGFITGEQVFGTEGLHRVQQSRRRLGSDIRPRRLVVRVSRVASRPLRRIRIASDDGVLLIGRSFIPIPGATLEPFEEATSTA